MTEVRRGTFIIATSRSYGYPSFSRLQTGLDFWNLEAERGKYVIGMNWAAIWGNTYKLNLLDSEGKLINSKIARIGTASRDYGETFEPIVYYHWEVEIPKDGQYQLELLQDKHSSGVAPANVAKYIYLKPLDR